MNSLDCLLAIARERKLNTPFGDFSTSRMYRVNTDSLRVRSGPSTSSTIVGGLKYGDVVEVKETVGSWAMIGDNKWVSMDYLVEVR